MNNKEIIEIVQAEIDNKIVLRQHKEYPGMFWDNNNHEDFDFVNYFYKIDEPEKQDLKFCGYTMQALIGAWAKSRFSNNIYLITAIIIKEDLIKIQILDKFYNEKEFLEDCRIIPETTGKFK